MHQLPVPGVFHRLLSANCITEAQIVSTEDGFFLVDKSLSDILAEKAIFDFPNSTGQLLPCDRFFDDWGNVDLNLAYSSSVTSQYNVKNVILTQTNNDGKGYATWAYDYKAKQGNAQLNAFLCSSSAFSGQVVYMLDSKIVIGANDCSYILTGRHDHIKYKIIFGAGDGTNVFSNWVDGNRHLGIISGESKLKF